MQAYSTNNPNFLNHDFLSVGTLRKQNEKMLKGPVHMQILDPKLLLFKISIVQKAWNLTIKKLAGFLMCKNGGYDVRFRTEFKIYMKYLWQNFA